MTRRLSEHVASPTPGDSALARQWKGVAGEMVRVRRRRRIVRGMAIAAPLVASIALFLFYFGRSRPDSLATGTTGPSASARSVDAGVFVELPEGSRLRVSPGANARILSTSREDVRVALDDGRIDVEASHDPARRSFVVSSGDFEVRVVGTVFSVVRSSARLEVGVREGRVQVVSRGSELGFVSAGETRIFEAVPEATANSATPVDQDAPIGVGASPEAADRPPPGTKMPAALPSSAPRSSPSSNPSDNPFEAAQKARVEGRLAEAARLFDDVRRKHRADPHAALAAFELGRLRLDALGDPAGAAEAFSDALVLGPGSALAEDAAARRVEALGRQGDHDRCAAARDAYLRQYPSGVYARAMVRFCK